MSKKKRRNETHTYISIPLHIDDLETRIRMKTSFAKNEVQFVVDTGSMMTLVSKNIIEEQSSINTSDTINLIGINGEENKLRSCGTLKGAFIIGSSQIEHTVQVVDEKINMSCDGLLGMNFLMEYKAKIDIFNKKLVLKIPKNTKKIESMKTSRDSFKCRPIFHSNDLVLEPRSLSNQKIQVPTNDIYIFEQGEIVPGVLLMESMAQSVDGEVTVPIMNLRDETVYIEPTSINLKTEEPPTAVVRNIGTSSILDPADRVEYIMQNLQLSHCDQEKLDAMRKLCEEFHDVFYIENDPSEITDLITHHIPLKPNSKPCFTRQYRIPYGQKAIIDEEVKKLAEKGLIRPSTSPFNSPLILVAKKSPKGASTPSYRLCVDFRALNLLSEEQNYVLPHMEDIYQTMHGSKVFSTCDLNAAYLSVPIAEEDKCKTAFTANNTRWEYQCMAFGLTSAPLTWAKAIQKCLEGMDMNHIFYFMDDCCCYTPDLASNVEYVRQMLQRFRRHKLKVKIEKSVFFADKIEFLGSVIDKDGVRPNPTKTAAIAETPAPKTVKHLQRFLGMCNFFRRHIEKYAEIARPLYDLTKKDTKFKWTGETQRAFDLLKLKLTTPPVLIFPCWDIPIYCTTDASSVAVAGFLSHHYPHDQPIEYFSKTLNEAQRHWPSTHLEIYAVVICLRAFAPYLFNREIFVVTDAKPITYLFREKNLSSKLIRFRLELMGQNIKFIYKKGKHNVVADFLSRPELPQSIEDIQRDQKPNTIAMAMTRNKSRELQMLKSAQDTNRVIERRKTSKIEYYIREDNNILYHGIDFDAVFYVFNDHKCEMRTKLERKLKEKIPLPLDFPPNSLFESSDKRMFVILGQTIRDSDQIRSAREIIHVILAQAKDMNLQKIAVNIDFDDHQSYFEFQKQFQSIFTNSTIETTFFLNKVIEISDVEDIAHILHMYHVHRLGGHNGIERMSNTIRRYFTWPTMKRDIKEFIRNCASCEMNKINRHTREPMQIVTCANKAFDHVAIDFVGEINPNSSEGHKYIFSAECTLTKFAIFVPTFDATALSAARALVEHIILKINIPSRLISDNAQAFLSDTMKEITKLLKIKHVLTSPYHPQANAVERVHKTLGAYLRAFCASEPDRWHELLSYAAFAHNNAVSTATKFTPHKLLYNFEIILPNKILKSQPSYNYDSFAAEAHHQLKKAQQLAKENDEKRKQENKKQYDKNVRRIELKKNDLVFLLKAVRQGKFATPNEGPYRVVALPSLTSAIIRKGKKNVRVHRNKLKLAHAEYARIPPSV